MSNTSLYMNSQDKLNAPSLIKNQLISDSVNIFKNYYFKFIRDRPIASCRKSSGFAKRVDLLSTFQWIQFFKYKDI